MTQNWALEIFWNLPHITFQFKKGKGNIIADSLSHLQCLGLYKRSPQEKPGGEYGITIFDEGETIHEHGQSEDFTASNPDMVTLVIDSKQRRVCK